MTMKSCDFCLQTHNYSHSGGIRWRKEILTVNVGGKTNMCRECMNMRIMAIAEGRE